MAQRPYKLIPTNGKWRKTFAIVFLASTLLAGCNNSRSNKQPISEANGDAWYWNDPQQSGKHSSICAAVYGSDKNWRVDMPLRDQESLYGAEVPHIVVASFEDAERTANEHCPNIRPVR